MCSSDLVSSTINRQRIRSSMLFIKSIKKKNGQYISRGVAGINKNLIISVTGHIKKGYLIKTVRSSLNIGFSQKLFSQIVIPAARMNDKPLTRLILEAYTFALADGAK